MENKFCCIFLVGAPSCDATQSSCDDYRLVARAALKAVSSLIPSHAILVTARDFPKRFPPRVIWRKDKRPIDIDNFLPAADLSLEPW